MSETTQEEMRFEEIALRAKFHYWERNLLELGEHRLNYGDRIYAEAILYDDGNVINNADVWLIFSFDDKWKSHYLGKTGADGKISAEFFCTDDHFPDIHWEPDEKRGLVYFYTDYGGGCGGPGHPVIYRGRFLKVRVTDQYGNPLKDACVDTDWWSVFPPGWAELRCDHNSLMIIRGTCDKEACAINDEGYNVLTDEYGCAYIACILDDIDVGIRAYKKGYVNERGDEDWTSHEVIKGDLEGSYDINIRLTGLTGCAATVIDYYFEKWEFDKAYVKVTYDRLISGTTYTIKVYKVYDTDMKLIWTKDFVADISTRTETIDLNKEDIGERGATIIHELWTGSIVCPFAAFRMPIPPPERIEVSIKVVDQDENPVPYALVDIDEVIGPVKREYGCSCYEADCVQIRKGTCVDEPVKNDEGHNIKTDVNGECEFILPKGSYGFRVYAEGYRNEDGRPDWSDHKILPSDSGKYDLKFRLFRGALNQYTFYVRVVDNEGSPIPGAEIDIDTLAFNIFGEYKCTEEGVSIERGTCSIGTKAPDDEGFNIITDEEGICVFGLPPPPMFAVYALRAYARDYMNESGYHYWTSHIIFDNPGVYNVTFTLYKKLPITVCLFPRLFGKDPFPRLPPPKFRIFPRIACIIERLK